MLMRPSFAVLLFVLFGSLPALAESEPVEEAASVYARTGSYMLLGTSYINDAGFADNYKERFGAGAKVDPAWGLRISTGYRFFDHLSAEAEFEWNPGNRVETPAIPKTFSSGIPSTVKKVKTLVFTANAKLPVLTGRIQPFGVIGAGLIRGQFLDQQISGDRHTRVGGVFRVGGGVDAYLTEDLFVSVDAVYLAPFGQDDLAGLQQVRLGLAAGFRF